MKIPLLLALAAVIYHQLRNIRNWKLSTIFSWGLKALVAAVALVAAILIMTSDSYLNVSDKHVFHPHTSIQEYQR